jgi:hypothetical protein
MELGRHPLQFAAEIYPTCQGRVGGEGDRPHARKRGQFRPQPVIKANLVLAARVLNFRQADAHSQHIVRVQRQRRVVEIHRAMNQKTGSGEQDDAQSHLEDDKQGGETSAVHASRGAATAILDSLVDIDFGELERGRQAKQDSSADGNQSQIKECLRIHREINPGWTMVIGGQAVEPTQAGEGDQPSAETARKGQERALDQKLANDAGASGADGNADGDLTRPRSGARQQEIGHIRAHDQEHKADCTDHWDQDPPGSVDADHIEKRDQFYESAFGAGRVRLNQVPGDGIDLVLRRCQADAIRQTAKHKGRLLPLPGEQVCGSQQRPQIRVFGELDTGRHDADDDARHFVDADYFAENGRILAVAVAPDAMAEHKAGTGIGPLIAGAEYTSQEGLAVDQTPPAGGHLHARIAFGKSVRVTHVDGRHAIGGQICNGMNARPQIPESGESRKGGEAAKPVAGR